MSKDTSISWTDHTFNPWWGCTKVSPACDHCYAESFSKRTGFKIWGKDAKRRFFGDEHWDEPVKWNLAAGKSHEIRRVFCASMADVMEDRADLTEERQRLYDLIERTPNLDWLLLTKRPQNFRRFLRMPVAVNIWAMTTVESPEYLWRIDALKACGAAVLGLSIEPLLAPIPTLGEHLDGIAWVIVGGESGPGARPMHPDWARSIRDQCLNLGIAFHFKQWGEFAPWREGLLDTSHGRVPRCERVNSGVPMDEPALMYRAGKKAAGALLDGREWREFPQLKGATHGK